MTTVFDECEPLLRAVAGLAVAAGVVAFYFGAQTVFGLVLAFVAVFGGGVVICCAALLSAWLLLGAKRVSKLMDSQKDCVLIGAYLAACAVSAYFFYIKVL